MNRSVSMKLRTVTGILVIAALFAAPVQAQLDFNWVSDPPAPAERATVTQGYLGSDGTVVWTTGPGKSASYNGSLNDFTITTLGMPPGYSEVQSLSVPNTGGYYVMGKAIGPPDPMVSAWAYTSVGWTQVGTSGVKYTVTDANEDYAVMHSQSGYGGVSLVSLNSGAPLVTPLPNQVPAEPGQGRISDNGLYVVHSGGGWQGSRISYDAGWATYRDLGVSYTDGLMTYAYDVNDSGNAVGYSQKPGEERALFYNFTTEVFSEIPDGPFTGKTLRPSYINNLNQVVGTVNGNEDLFYYDYATNTTTNLWDMVAGETGSNPQVGPNWISWNSPLYISGINDLGYIAGSATGEMPWGGGGPYLNMFLLVSPPSISNPGDVDEDNFVGGADLTTILTNWGSSGVSWGDGDVNPYPDGDDFIGGGDYTAVLTAWGTSYGPETVPEPLVSSLMLVMSLFVFRRKNYGSRATGQL